MFMCQRITEISVGYHESFQSMSLYYSRFFELDIFDYNTISALAYAALMQKYDTDAIPMHTLDDTFKMYAHDIRASCLL